MNCCLCRFKWANLLTAVGLCLLLLPALAATLALELLLCDPSKVGDEPSPSDEEFKCMMLVLPTLAVGMAAFGGVGYAWYSCCTIGEAFDDVQRIFVVPV